MTAKRHRRMHAAPLLSPTPKPAVTPTFTWAAIAVGALCWLLPLSTTWRLAPDLGHAWIVPVLMAYLWWERWQERPAAISPGSPARIGWILAFAIGAIHLLLRLLLTPFPLWPSVLALYTALFAATALAGAWMIAGWPGVRWVGGPLILALATLPVPSSVESAVIVPLRVLWASLAAEVSNLAGLPAIAFGTSVRIGNGWVGIDEACGGIRSLQACAMIGLFFGEWYRFSLLRRAALVAAGLAAALIGNFARVLFLSIRASEGTHAVESAHDLAGWLAMAASLGLTGWLACRWSGYRWPESRPAAAMNTKPAVVRTVSGAWRGSTYSWIAVVAGLFSANELATRLWFHFGEQAIAQTPQWTPHLPTGHWSFRTTPLPDLARELLQPDEFAAGSWRDENDARVSAHYIKWSRGQIARSLPFLHNPTVCLPLAGCELLGPLPTIEVGSPAGGIPFYAYKFRQSGDEILVAFTIWDSARARPLVKADDNSSWAHWWSLQWTEVREAHRHQPAQLLAVTVPWNDQAQQHMATLLSSLIAPRSGKISE